MADPKHPEPDSGSGEQPDLPQDEPKPGQGQPGLHGEEQPGEAGDPES